MAARAPTNWHIETDTEDYGALAAACWRLQCMCLCEFNSYQKVGSSLLATPFMFQAHIRTPAVSVDCSCGEAFALVGSSVAIPGLGIPVMEQKIPINVSRDSYTGK